MEILVIGFLFILGLAFGSFLNAFEYRLFNKKDWIRERSHCPNCKHELSSLDLVPVLSWLFLGGKCRYCSKKISFQYPFIELVTGFLFSVYGYIWFQSSFLNSLTLSSSVTIVDFIDFAALLFGLIVVWALVFFSVYDLKYGLIPDKVLFPLIGITFVWNIFLSISQVLDYSSVLNFDFWNHILAAILAGGFFFLIIYLTKGKGMGGGDMKLVFWFGLILGTSSTLLSLYISFIVGGLYGAVILLVGKKKFGQTVPFGPFLCFGFLLVFLFQKDLLGMVNNLLFGGLL